MGLTMWRGGAAASGGRRRGSGKGGWSMVSRVKRIRVMSDLHLEFGPLDIVPAGEDVLVVAGDIGVYTDGAVWARSYARRHDIPVVIIAGNHEFYRNSERPAYTVESTLAALTAVANS